MTQDDLDTIITAVLGGDGWDIPGNHDAVKNAALQFANGNVQLAMWPADTCYQAQAVYNSPGAVAALLALDQWERTPNPHFGFVRTQLAYLSTKVPLARYLTYWRDNVADLHRWDRAEWDTFWARMEQAGAICPGDRGIFDADFTHTDRKFATPRPGIACTFDWPIVTAQMLHADGQFESAVKERINQLLAALGEKLI